MSLAAGALFGVLALAGCSSDEGLGLRIENGDEYFVTSDVKNVTNQEAFDFMVSQRGVGTILDMADEALLRGNFEFDNEPILGQIESMRGSVPNFEDWMFENGFETEAELISFLELGQLRAAAIREGITIDEEDIRFIYDQRFPALELDEESVEQPSEAEEGTDTEDAAEAEEDDAAQEEVAAVPEFEEVRDEIYEELMASYLRDNAIFEGEMARLREEAGFIIEDEFLHGLYLDYLLAMGVANAEEIISGPGEGGTAIAARLGDVEFTSEQLFAELMPSMGLQAGVNLQDFDILQEKFEVDRQEVTDLVNNLKIQMGEQFYPTMAMNNLHGDQEIFHHFELLKLQEAAFLDVWAPSEERLRELYDAFVPNVSARHILVDDEEQARELIAQLEAADDVEAKFMELAEEHSTDTVTAANGGDLGSFAPGRMVAPFEEAAFALEEGQFTHEPVESDFGYHIIFLYDRDEKPSFEDMRESLEIQEHNATYTTELLESVLIDLRSEVNFAFTDPTLQTRYDLIVRRILDSLENE